MDAINEDMEAEKACKEDVWSRDNQKTFIFGGDP